MKIFLSAVSIQFRACRDALRSDLTAVGAQVVVQEDFQQHAASLLQKLQDYIASCDRIIALVGDAYGFEPDDVARPADRPRRSYTQWEYFFAIGERLDGTSQPAKDIFLYFASQEFLAMHPPDQLYESSQLQNGFIKQLHSSGKDWNQFGTLQELRALVLRDGFTLQDRPPQPRNLPYTSLGSLFKGRERVISELHKRLQDNPARAVVVYAQAGVGKTRLMIEYALRHEAEYSALLIVGSSSAEALQRNLASLCGAQVLNLAEREAKEQEIKSASALRWLGQHDKWLLILDNADTQDAASDVEALLPRLRSGHVVITSRLSDWSSSVDTLGLQYLSVRDGAEFLLERTKDRRVPDPSDINNSKELAAELDGLALALEQAGAFISQVRCSFQDYLQRRRAREVKVRAWHDARLMHYPFSMALTWDTSFEQLDGSGRALLELLCWLAPEPIPRSLLADMRLTRRMQGSAPENVDTEDALASLAAFSMLRWDVGNHAFRIHRLTLEAGRERVPEEHRNAVLQGILHLVDHYLPGDPPPDDVRSWPIWEAMAEHVAQLILRAAEARIGHPTSRLASLLGMYLGERGLSDTALLLARLALQIDEQLLGPDHPTVATRLNNVAQHVEDVAEAEPLLRRALAIEEKQPDPEQLALRLHNLAALLVKAKRFAEAEPLIRRAVEIDGRVSGKQHPDYARDLNLLAALLVSAHRQVEAEPIIRRALVIDEKCFGPGHPIVARDLYNLSEVLWDLNRLDEAEPLLRRAFYIQKQSYGDAHDTVRRTAAQLKELLKQTKYERT